MEVAEEEQPKNYIIEQASMMDMAGGQKYESVDLTLSDAA